MTHYKNAQYGNTAFPFLNCIAWEWITRISLLSWALCLLDARLLKVVKRSGGSTYTLVSDCVTGKATTRFPITIRVCGSHLSECTWHIKTSRWLFLLMKVRFRFSLSMEPVRLSIRDFQIWLMIMAKLLFVARCLAKSNCVIHIAFCERLRFTGKFCNKLFQLLTICKGIVNILLKIGLGVC